MEIAEKQQCRVMLNGQFGNYTISYGDFLTHVITMYRKGKLIKILKEINGFSSLYKIPKSKVRRLVLESITPYGIRKFVKLKVRKEKNDFDRNLVSESLANKWKIKDRYETYGYYTEVDKYYDLNDTNKNMIDPVPLCQMASIVTKLSLAKGMVVRDPTRDKRVIEYCMSLPTEQYVRNGHERYLLKRSMKGILPDKIRMNISTRGMQSADWIQRLQPQWKCIYDKIQLMMYKDSIKKYLDLDRLNNDLILLGDSIDEEHSFETRELLVSLIFSQFIKSFDR